MTVEEALTAQRDEAREERDELRAWQLAVAEGMGYVNRAEGVGGYEVAPASVIVDSWNQMATEHADGYIAAVHGADRRADELEAELATVGTERDEMTRVSDEALARCDVLLAELADCAAHLEMARAMGRGVEAELTASEALLEATQAERTRDVERATETIASLERAHTQALVEAKVEHDRIMAQLQIAEAERTAAGERVAELEAAETMYGSAWQRELGQHAEPFRHKHHIDAMVLATRGLVAELTRLRADLAKSESVSSGFQSLTRDLDRRIVSLRADLSAARAEAASVAERQREACAVTLAGMGFSERDAEVPAIRATPLVTGPAPKPEACLMPNKVTDSACPCCQRRFRKLAEMPPKPSPRSARGADDNG